MWRTVTSNFDLSCPIFASAYSDAVGFKNARPTFDESAIDDDDQNFIGVHETTMESIAEIITENDHNYALRVGTQIVKVVSYC